MKAHLIAIVVLCSCLPELEDRASSIAAPRIVAVVMDPPEAAPGDVVHFEITVASPDGVVDAPQAYWSLCLSPKPPAENNAVNTACWDKDYRPVGGPAGGIDIAIPDDGCALFGPEVASAEMRPRDPDETGGYYQPIRVAIPELAAFAFERIRCDLPNASAEVSFEYAARYHVNVNPALVSVSTGGEVRASSPIVVRAEWDPDSAEPFVVYDAAEQRLVDTVEELRVSWFATAGTFAFDVTDPGSDGVSSENTITLPDLAEPVTLWAVLRDSRGGSSVLTTVLDVAP